MAKLLLPLTLVYNYDEIIAIKIKIMSHVSLKSDVAKPAPLLEKNVIAHVRFFVAGTRGAVLRIMHDMDEKSSII